MSDSLKEAQNLLIVDSVVLRGSTLSVKEDFEPAEYGNMKTITQQYRRVLNVRQGQVTDLLTDDEYVDYQFVYDVGVRALPIEDNEESLADPNYEPLIEIEATFVARYAAKQELSEDQAKAFAQDNVGYHVWPYWREFVQSTSARVGLVPIISLPMYKHHQLQLSNTESEVASATAGFNHQEA